MTNGPRNHLFESSNGIAPVLQADIPLNVKAGKVAVSQPILIHINVLVCTIGFEQSPESRKFGLVLSVKLEIGRLLSTTVEFGLSFQIVRKYTGSQSTGGDEIRKWADGGFVNEFWKSGVRVWVWRTSSSYFFG